MFSIEFIDKYQTLIGSALGPFLAIILSGIAYLLKILIENHIKYRENLRRIEISTARSIDSFIKAQMQLQQNISSIRKLAKDIEKITNKKEFSLDRTNFSYIREIYRDNAITNFKIRSYYLCNKLLWIDAGIKELNEINKNFRDDFKDLIRTNELLISLMKDNLNLDPQIQSVAFIRQRISYINNLRNFANGVEKYIADTAENIKFIKQANVYNNNLRKRYGKGLYFKWKEEGISFKYFKNKKKMNEFIGNLDSIDRIDKLIEEEVEDLTNKIKERMIKINVKK